VANSIRLSINEATHTPPVQRGHGAFDAQALRSLFDATPLETELDSDALASYRTFYALDFPDTQQRMWPIAVGAERIAVQAYVPQTPRSEAFVLLCHGYFDHVGLYRHVIEYLLNHGLTVVTYDQLGHGLSTGERVVIDDFSRYVEATEACRQFAAKQFNWSASTRVHWFGQSMGGSVIMDYLQHTAHPPTGEVVLFAPLVRPYAWWLNRWVFALAKLAITQRPRTITSNAYNPEFIALQHVDRLQAQVLPVAWVSAMVNWFKRFEASSPSTIAPKIVQGDTDHTVSWRHNMKVLSRLYPQQSLLMLSQGRHHLANESVEIREKIFTWLDAECDW